MSDKTEIRVISFKKELEIYRISQLMRLLPVCVCHAFLIELQDALRTGELQPEMTHPNCTGYKRHFSHA